MVKFQGGTQTFSHEKPGYLDEKVAHYLSNNQGWIVTSGMYHEGGYWHQDIKKVDTKKKMTFSHKSRVKAGRLREKFLASNPGWEAIGPCDFHDGRHHYVAGMKKNKNNAATINVNISIDEDRVEEITKSLKRLSDASVSVDNKHFKCARCRVVHPSKSKVAIKIVTVSSNILKMRVGHNWVCMDCNNKIVSLRSNLCCDWCGMDGKHITNMVWIELTTGEAKALDRNKDDLHVVCKKPCNETIGKTLMNNLKKQEMCVWCTSRFPSDQLTDINFTSYVIEKKLGKLGFHVGNMKSGDNKFCGSCKTMINETMASVPCKRCHTSMKLDDLAYVGWEKRFCELIEKDPDDIDLVCSKCKDAINKEMDAAKEKERCAWCGYLGRHEKMVSHPFSDKELEVLGSLHYTVARLKRGNKIGETCVDTAKKAIKRRICVGCTRITPDVRLRVFTLRATKILKDYLTFNLTGWEDNKTRLCNDCNTLINQDVTMLHCNSCGDAHKDYFRFTVEKLSVSQAHSIGVDTIRQNNHYLICNICKERHGRQQKEGQKQKNQQKTTVRPVCEWCGRAWSDGHNNIVSVVPDDLPFLHDAVARRGRLPASGIFKTCDYCANLLRQEMLPRPNSQYPREHCEWCDAEQLLPFHVLELGKRDMRIIGTPLMPPGIYPMCGGCAEGVDGALAAYAKRLNEAE